MNKNPGNQDTLKVVLLAGSCLQTFLLPSKLLLLSPSK